MQKRREMLSDHYDSLNTLQHATVHFTRREAKVRRVNDKLRLTPLSVLEAKRLPD